MAKAIATAHQSDRRRRSGARWLAVLALVATAVAGCGTAPGAAVAVDGMTVSTTAVLDRSDSVLAEAQRAGDVTSRQRAIVNRNQVTQLIRHQLVLAAADDRNIDVSDAEVSKFIEQYEQSGNGKQMPPAAGILGVPQDDVRDAVYDFLVLLDMANAMPDAGVEVTNVIVTLDAVAAPDRAAAVAARVRYAADPAAMDADAAAALAENPRLPSGKLSLLQGPHNAGTGIFTAAEGEILLVPQTTNGYLVIRITKRVEQPGTLTAQALAQVTQAAGANGRVMLESLLLGPYVAAADVSVNPRFGQWDPRVVQVVATDVP